MRAGCLAELHIDVARDGDTARIACSGELDLASSVQLADAFEMLATDGVRRVEVDLGAVSFMDSTGLRVLIAAKQRLPVLRLARRSSQVGRVLNLTGAAGIFGPGTATDA